jgi:hypothetical protein
MHERKREDVIRQCERLLAEQDPEVFRELGTELIALLEDKTSGPPGAKSEADFDPTRAPVN